MNGKRIVIVHQRAKLVKILVIELLVIGYWLLVIGNWLLVIGNWLLVIGNWLLVICYLLLSYWSKDSTIQRFNN